MSEAEEQNWYTAKDASAYLQVSEMTIFRWMKSGKLSYFKLGGSLRFKKENLDMVAQKTTGHTEVGHLHEKCSVCGHHEMVEGKPQGTGRLYFKPNKTKFFVFSESLVALKAQVCTACGYMQMFADTEKISKLKVD